MSNIDEDRQAIITNLQNKAKEILELKQKHRHHRPIVIEFSGSPKSGKTTCISSLALFLKRNEFKVEVIQERASICPVTDKKDPMFNIWTACTSITAMISQLEQKAGTCDVIILDRGIFDALCWFEWQFTIQALSSSHKKIIDDFLCIDLIVNRVDIVFAFTVTPEKSIEREYAHLLTDKPGSIMRISVLGDYLAAIEHTIETKAMLFHHDCIKEIDTTSMNQDMVGKEVTEQTLEILKNMLMERIGYISPSNDFYACMTEKRVIHCEKDSVDQMLGELKFGLRSEVEENKSVIQPVPILVLTDKTKKMVLVVKKKKEAVSDDSPEKDKLLLYVGGHSRYEDCTEKTADNILAICRYTLQREVKEEIGISLSFDEIEPFLIYTPDSPKSKKHLAVCFVVERDDIEELKLSIDSEELVLNRGTSKSGSFQCIDSLIRGNGELNSFEPWSIEICIHMLKPSTQLKLGDDTRDHQISLFDID